MPLSLLGMAARSGSCCVAAEADRPAAVEFCRLVGSQRVPLLQWALRSFLFFCLNVKAVNLKHPMCLLVGFLCISSIGKCFICF